MEKAIIIELAKLALSLYFTTLRLAGLSEEEIEKRFREDRADALKRHPSKLRD